MSSSPGSPDKSSALTSELEAPKTLRDLTLALLCKTRPPAFSTSLKAPYQLVPDLLECLLAGRNEADPRILPYVIVNQIVELLHEKGTLNEYILRLLLHQSRGHLTTLRLHLTQLTFDEFLNLPPITGLVEFDCTNIESVTDQLSEKLKSSRSTLRSFSAVGLENASLNFRRLAEFSSLSTLNVSSTLISVDDVNFVCTNLNESLTFLDVSECTHVDFYSILPGLDKTPNLKHLSVHSISIMNSLAKSDTTEIVSTFKSTFARLSSLTFLDVAFIRSIAGLSAWEVARSIITERRRGLTHLDISGLCPLRDTLDFIRTVEHDLQYVGALHFNIEEENNDDEEGETRTVLASDNELSNYLDDRAVDEADEMKVGTGFGDTDSFVLFQPHYVAPTREYDEVLRLLAGQQAGYEEDIGNHWQASNREMDVLTSFVLQKCRALRRRRCSMATVSCLLDLVYFTSTVCILSSDVDESHVTRLFALLYELVLKAFTSPSSVNLLVTVHEVCQMIHLGEIDVSEELKDLMVSLAFGYMKEGAASNSLCFLLREVLSKTLLNRIATDRGLVSALIDMVDTSLEYRRHCEAAVRVFNNSPLLSHVETSLFVTQHFIPILDQLCSMYEAIVNSNARQAESLLDTFYLLSIQKRNRVILRRTSVFQLIWRCLNFSQIDDLLYVFAGDLFVSLTCECSESLDYGRGLSSEAFWDRICKYFSHKFGSEDSHSLIYINRQKFRHTYSVEVALACLRAGVLLSNVPFLVYSLSSFEITYRDGYRRLLLDAKSVIKDSLMSIDENVSDALVKRLVKEVRKSIRYD
eukprot:m.128262 g.128262  ORF g.128262 m.128262 type:complete len:809 (+) comp37947_c0_seq1:62-2488(+)